MSFLTTDAEKGSRQPTILQDGGLGSIPSFFRLGPLCRDPRPPSIECHGWFLSSVLCSEVHRHSLALRVRGPWSVLRVGREGPVLGEPTGVTATCDLE